MSESINKNRHLAVLTCDFVNSKKVPKDRRKHLPSLALQAYYSFYPESKEFQIFRGDGFQIRVLQIEKALELAIGMRMYFIAHSTEMQISRLDARISIGIGFEDFYRADVGKSNGLAYQISGEGLDSMQIFQRLRISLQNTEEKSMWNTLLNFADFVISKITPAQAQVCLLTLLGKNQEESAKMVNISQAAVNQRLKAANWYLLKDLLAFYSLKIKPSSIAHDTI